MALYNCIFDTNIQSRLYMIQQYVYSCLLFFTLGKYNPEGHKK